MLSIADNLWHREAGSTSDLHCLNFLKTSAIRPFQNQIERKLSNLIIKFYLNLPAIMMGENSQVKIYETLKSAKSSESQLRCRRDFRGESDCF
jgi:hypothetical protein